MTRRLPVGLGRRRVRGGRRTGPRGDRPAFTLIELLVVVGIIALLIAMLVPSLLAARRETRRVVCQANLKQVVGAAIGYLEENKGFFPRVALADINFGGRQGTEPTGIFGSTTAHSPFQRKKPVNKHLGLPLIATRGAEVFSCPDDAWDRSAETRPPATVEDTYFAYYGTSYFANPLLIGSTPYFLSRTDPCHDTLSDAFKSLLPTVTAGQYQQHSKLLLVGDAVWQNAWNFASKEAVRQWHGGLRRYNVGFADGHVDTVEIRRGIHVNSQYTVLPTRGLQSDAAQCQGGKQ